MVDVHKWPNYCLIADLILIHVTVIPEIITYFVFGLKKANAAVYYNQNFGFILICVRHVARGGVLGIPESPPWKILTPQKFPKNSEIQQDFLFI